VIAIAARLEAATTERERLEAELVDMHKKEDSFTEQVEGLTSKL